MVLSAPYIVGPGEGGVENCQAILFPAQRREEDQNENQQYCLEPLSLATSIPTPCSNPDESTVQKETGSRASFELPGGSGAALGAGAGAGTHARPHLWSLRQSSNHFVLSQSKARGPWLELRPSASSSRQPSYSQCRKQATKTTLSSELMRNRSP